MALNFLGLGFSFGAKDSGLGKTLKGLREDFASIGKEILSLQRLQTFLSAMTFDKLDALSSKIKDIGVGGLNLTSNLESTFQQSNVAARKFGANLGLTGKELTTTTAKASSLAYSLGVSAEEAGKAVLGFKEASGVLKMLGINSEESFVKLGAVTGLDTKKFTYDLTQLQKATQLDDTSLANVIASAKKYGVTVGDIGGTLGSVSEDITDMLEQQINVFHKTPKEAAKFAESFYVLADAMQSAGASVGVNGKAFAKTVADAMNNAGDNLAGMMAGTDNDIGEFMTKMSSTFGMTADQIQNLMKSDPTTFIGTIADAVGRLDGKKKPEAILYMQKQLEGLLGKEGATQFAALMKNDAARASLGMDQLAKRTGEVAKTTSNALGQVAKDGYASTLTASESFTRLQDIFVQKIRNKSSMTSGQFLKSAQSSFQDFNSGLDSMYNKGGMGKFLVQKLADLEKFGALGLIPKNLVGDFSIAGTAVDKLAGPLAKLRSIGINVLSPLGLMTSAVGALGVQFLSLRKQAKEDLIGKMMKEGMSKKQAEEAVGGVFGAATQEALTRLGEKVYKFVAITLPKFVVSGVKKLAGAVRNLISKGFKAGFDRADVGDTWSQVFSALKEELVLAWEGLKNFFSGLWDGLMGNFNPEEKTDTKFLGGALGNTLRNAFMTAFQYVKEFLSGAWTGLFNEAVPEDASATSKLGNTIGLKIREAFDIAYTYVKNYLAEWWKKVNEIWDNPELSTQEKLTSILKESGGVLAGVAGLFILFGPQIMGVLSVIGFVFSLLNSVIGLLMKVPFGAVFEGLSTAVQFLWDAVWLVFQLVGLIFGIPAELVAAIVAVVGLAAAFMAWPEATRDAIDNVVAILYDAGKWVGVALTWMFMWPFKIIYEAFEGLFGEISTASSDAINPAVWVSKILDFVGSLGPALASSINGILEVIRGLFVGLLDGIKETLMGMFPAFAGPIEFVFNFIKGAINAILGFVEGVIAAIGEVIDIVVTVVTGVWGIMSSLISALFSLIGSFGGWLWGFISPIVEGIGDLFGGIFAKIKPAWDAMANFFSGVWTTLSGGAENAVNWVKEKFMSVKDWVIDLLNQLDGALAKLPGGESAEKRITERNAKREKEKEQLKLDRERATRNATSAVNVATTAAAAPKPTATSSVIKPPAAAGGLKMPTFPSTTPAASTTTRATPTTTPTVAKPTPAVGEPTFTGLVDSVNDPKWVSEYMKLMIEQHRELMREIKGGPIRAGASGAR